MSRNALLISALIFGFLWAGAAYAQEPSCQLALTSEPKGAEVILRDSSGEGFVGKTPYLVSICEPGVYRLSIALEGYETWSASLSVEPGRSYLLPKVVLEKKVTTVQSSLPEGGAEQIEPFAALASPLSDDGAAPVPGQKSPGTALGLSLGLTAASYGVLAAGLLASDDEIGTGLLFTGFAGAAMAPSVGHFYAGEWRHGLLSSSLRLSTPLVGLLLTEALDDRVIGIAVGVAGFVG